MTGALKAIARVAECLEMFRNGPGWQLHRNPRSDTMEISTHLTKLLTSTLLSQLYA